MRKLGSRNPCKKVLWTSSWRIGQWWWIANAITVRIVVCLTTGLNVSVKSSPSYWWNQFATKRALYLSIDPSGSRLILKTHLFGKMFIRGRVGTNDHVPLSYKASNSAPIAFLQATCLTAWLKHEGSTSESLVTSKAYLGLSLTIFVRLLVTIL